MLVLNSDTLYLIDVVQHYSKVDPVNLCFGADGGGRKIR